MHHPTFSATLAEQHRVQLRYQADQIRLSRGGRPYGRPHRPRGLGWWRPATRPARA